MNETDLAHLRRCIELAAAARGRGDRPFGSLLVDGDGKVLREAMNSEVTENDATGHPEFALARWASMHLTPGERASATLYTSCESCAMCAGAQYWAGIGRLVFALSGDQLRAALPPGAPTLALGSRELFAHGNTAITVEGPAAELESEAHEVHAGYW